MSKESVFLKLTSAIAIDGAVVRAGSLVEVTQTEAKNLLHRGKAVLATERDGAPVAGDDDGADDKPADNRKAKAKAKAEPEAATEGAE